MSTGLWNVYAPVIALIKRLQAAFDDTEDSLSLDSWWVELAAEHRDHAEELFQAHFANSTRWHSAVDPQRRTAATTDLKRYRCTDP